MFNHRFGPRQFDWRDLLVLLEISENNNERDEILVTLQREKSPLYLDRHKEWHARSLDLNPNDFFLFNVYTTQPDNLEDLWQ